MALGFEDAYCEFDPAGFWRMGDGVIFDGNGIGFDIGFEEEGLVGVNGEFNNFGLVVEGMGGDGGCVLVDKVEVGF